MYSICLYVLMNNVKFEKLFKFHCREFNAAKCVQTLYISLAQFIRRFHSMKMRCWEKIYLKIRLLSYNKRTLWPKWCIQSIDPCNKTFRKSFNCRFIFILIRCYLGRKLLISHFTSIFYSTDGEKKYWPNNTQFTNRLSQKRSLSFCVITKRAQMFFLMFFFLFICSFQEIRHNFVEKVQRKKKRKFYERGLLFVFRVSNLKNGIFHCDIGC